VYVRELRVMYRLKRVSGKTWPIATQLAIPSDAAKAFITLLGSEPVEVCGMFACSTKHVIVAYHEVSRGCLDTTLVHPREVFKAAILSNAAAIIVGHNHPSGDVTPSADDLALTLRLSAAGDLLGISMLDHLIVSGSRYFSFREAGHL